MRRVLVIGGARRRASVFAFVSLLLASAPALAAPPAYAPVGSYSLGAFSAFDVAGVGAGAHAGRVFGLAPDGGIWRQDAINLGAFTRIGAVDGALLSGFGPSFLSLSPDGSMLALGDGNFGAGASVLLVATAALDPGSNSAATAIAAPNYAGEWADGATLLVSGADPALGSVLTRIDASALEARVVVGNIGGASGGVALDGQFVYTGNAYDFDPTPGTSDTGEVRAFALASITGAAASGVPLDFETLGRPVADALSASSLAFDAAGNLFVGGGDFFGASGDFGYAAAVGAGGIQNALAGGALAPDTEEHRVSPAGMGEFYAVEFNPVTDEWLVSAGGVVYRYAIPAPATLFAFAPLALTPRRRRDAR